MTVSAPLRLPFETRYAPCLPRPLLSKASSRSSLDAFPSRCPRISSSENDIHAGSDVVPNSMVWSLVPPWKRSDWAIDWTREEVRSGGRNEGKKESPGTEGGRREVRGGDDDPDEDEDPNRESLSSSAGVLLVYEHGELIWKYPSSR